MKLLQAHARGKLVRMEMHRGEQEWAATKIQVRERAACARIREYRILQSCLY